MYMANLIFAENEEITQNLSSAAVVIGAQPPTSIKSCKKSYLFFVLIIKISYSITTCLLQELSCCHGNQSPTAVWRHRSSGFIRKS